MIFFGASLVVLRLQQGIMRSASAPCRAVSHFSEAQMRVRDGSADVAGAVYGHHACLRDLDRKPFQACPSVKLPDPKKLSSGY